MGRGDGPVEPSQGGGPRLCCLGEQRGGQQALQRSQQENEANELWRVSVCCPQSNQRVDLYSWQNDSASVHTSLQGHTRVIR